MTTATLDLTVATPAEIDYALGPVHYRHAVALNQLIHARGDLAKLRRHQPTSRWGEQLLAEAEANVDRYVAEVETAGEALAEFQAEWDRRGGWTRSWLCVTSGHGHFHRTHQCQTLRNTSQLALAYSLSGLDDATLVAMAGSDACTYCYPNAPVDRPAEGWRATGNMLLAERAQQAARQIAHLDEDIDRMTSRVVAMETAGDLAEAERLRNGDGSYSPFRSYTRTIVDKRSHTNAVKKARRIIVNAQDARTAAQAHIDAAAHLDWAAWQPGLVPAHR